MRAGRDFATTVIGDPWDFDQATDYSLMYSLDAANQLSFTGIPTLTNGVLRAVSRTRTPHLQIQFEGIDGGLNIVGRNGVVHPIDASKYRRLSFRLRRTAVPSDPAELVGAVWFTGTARSAATIGGYLSLSRGYDNVFSQRYANQSPVASQGNTGFHVYKLDLDQPGLKYGPNFAGTVRGLLLKLGDAPELVNATIELDWVRLTERGATTKVLQWSGFGGSVTLTATHSQTGQVVQIFPDNGTSATTFSDNTSYTWDYGYLPPGTWVLTAQGNGKSRSVTLNIDAEPVINVTEPDAAGGRDFARTKLGDAWDLTNPQDVTRHGRLWQAVNPAFGANGLTSSTNGNDPFVQMLDDWNDPPGTELRLDAARFHRLTFTLEYPDTKYMTGPDSLGDNYGGVIRVAWRGAGNNGGPYTQTKPLVLLDGGPHRYSLDLRALDYVGDGSDPLHEIEPGGSGLWQGQVSNLRIDPHEALLPRTYRMSDVRLAEDDKPNGTGFFTIRWNVSDATFSAGVADSGGAGATVSLYRDTDTNPSNGMTLIKSGLAAQAGQYLWSTAGQPAGTYYVYAVVQDALHSQGRYSTGPVAVSAMAAHTDANGNGMDDAWESLHGVSSASSDADGDGLSNLDEFRRGSSPTVSNSWQLSEGATGTFFAERLALANPASGPSDVTVKYLRESGAPVTRRYSVDPFSRLTVRVNEIAELGAAAVSALITVDTGTVIAERTMFWDPSGYGGHTGKGIQKPSTQWFLAEGEAGFFSTFILLANANTTTASVQVTYLLENDAPVVRNYTVAPESRLTIFANNVSGVKGKAFSTAVSSSIPITVERAMYFTSQGRLWNGGTGAAAVAAPSTSWFVAEGRTGPFFDTFMLLANPNSAAATATIRYLLPGGSVRTETRSLPPTSRTTIWVDGLPGMQDTDVSASITATRPIVVERAMYWPGNFTQWYEAHASAGVTSAATRWGLAEGELGGALGYSTFILLANPSSSAATVRMTMLREQSGPVSQTFSVPANSRLTKSAAEFGLGSGERFGTLVESTNGVPIVVERAMYWNGAGQFWNGGTNESATRLK